MADTIFGILVSDELKLNYHRALLTGIQHNYNISPLKPLPGEPVKVCLTIGPEISCKKVVCRFTTDGSIPEIEGGHDNSISLTLEHSFWDDSIWDYAQLWSGEIPPQPEGTLVRFKLFAFGEDGKVHQANHPDSKLNIERATHAHFTGDPIPPIDRQSTSGETTFCYHVNTFSPPDWAKKAIIYHIFLDRFSPGEGKAWLKPKHEDGFYGGNLWGVIDHLDYLQDLGITAIWLSPTWKSPSYHRYDVIDYHAVDDLLGGEKAMRALVEEAHKRDLRIVLDLVLNHMSNESELFLEATRDPHSKARDWFIFDNSEIGYQTYFGVKKMPKINLQNPVVREWAFAVGQYWLEKYDIDGYRLDHANGPGPEFWAGFRVACRSVKADTFCFGEIVEPPERMRQYEGSLDGVLDFAFCEAVRRTFGYQSLSPSRFDNFLSRHAEFFRDSGLLMPAFLDNHDMDRFLYIAEGDKERLKEAAQIQFRQSGPPIIYYGTEIGLHQKKGTNRNFSHAREPMVWDHRQDRSLFEFYQALIEAHKNDLNARAR